MALPGIMISFEGIDGAGKSTHIDALGARFRSHGRTVTVTREPGGTPLAEKLREMLLHDSMDVLTEALLVFAGRRDHVEKVIEPALSRGEVVLCDRFTDSSFAYQGGGQGLDLSVLATLEQWVQGGHGPNRTQTRHPDLSLWFDMPPEIAAERLSAARAPDRFEARGVEFFARVAHGYALRAMQFPDRFCRILANRDRDAVWSDVERAVLARGWLA